jgi:EAL domain-containing protein (putative c-di-GMP-specific phosphodiesterase class I)/CheY-like chemotaxis protein
LGIRLNARVVVIDDEHEYLALIEAFSAAFLVTTVKFDHWSDETLEDLQHSDLLILDIRMPDVDGIDVLVKLADANYRGGIVLMTGSDEDLIESVRGLANKLKLDVVGILNKPFRLSHFKNILEKFLARQPESGTTEQSHPQALSYDDLKNIMDKKLYYPVYQPQYDVMSNHITGIECLSRIRGPFANDISTPSFIHALTKHGLIHTYTHDFIEMALADLSEAIKLLPDIPVSFNIDASSLKKELIKDLTDVISQFSIKLNNITFEITESNAIRMDPEALYCVSKMRNAGINLSIDDFGTGYSTIQSLIELPFNELKIDRSFILQIEHNQKALEIIRAIQLLSESLSFKLVCEGVESKKQLTQLSNIGCKNIQGFYYSKPIQVDALMRLAQHQPLDKVPL